MSLTPLLSAVGKWRSGGVGCLGKAGTWTQVFSLPLSGVLQHLLCTSAPWCLAVLQVMLCELNQVAEFLPSEPRLSSCKRFCCSRGWKNTVPHQLSSLKTLQLHTYNFTPCPPLSASSETTVWNVVVSVANFIFVFVKLVLFTDAFTWLIAAKLARGNETFHKMYLYRDVTNGCG